MQIKSIDMESRRPDIEEVSALLDAPGFDIIMDRMIDGVVIADAKGMLRSINSAALHMNGLQNAAMDGASLAGLLAQSSLDWGDFADCALGEPGAQAGTRRREFIAASDEGRSILISVRRLRDARSDSGGGNGLTLIFMRDLQQFDHLRRTAAGVEGGNVFKFLSDRDIGPDFEVQRRLSADINQMILRGTRALHQGARLLLIGESGSGKTELAKYFHRAVGTPEEAFIHVNCGAIPESLFEAEMFGHEKGAFTGALQNGKRGLIETAEGGTLFLDEIGEVPLSSQAKLLRFLEDGVVQRVGGRTGRKINTRIISATNRDLWRLVRENRFRGDLYYRLAVITLEAAALRDQPQLITHLIDHFTAAANRMRKPRLQVSEACRAVLRGHDYPGNIRELHNLIQHLSVAAEDEARPEHLPPYVRRREAQPRTGAMPAPGCPDAAAAPPRPLREQVKSFERDLIDDAIDRLGSKRKAARALGVDIGTIVRKTKEKLPLS